MKTAIEWCPYCENEVEVHAESPSPCPVCGKTLVPCSTCQDSLSRPYFGCNWTKERGCWRFRRPDLNIELYKFTINAIEAKRKASKGEVTTLEFARMAQLRPDIWCDIRAFRKVATTKELKNIKNAAEKLV